MAFRQSQGTPRTQGRQVASRPRASQARRSTPRAPHTTSSSKTFHPSSQTRPAAAPRSAGQRQQGPQRAGAAQGQSSKPLGPSFSARPSGAPAPSSFDRRTLVKGALGLGGLAAAGSVVSSIQGCAKDAASQDLVAPAQVDEKDAVQVMDDYSYVEGAPNLAEVGRWQVALGTVLYPSEGNWIAATLTGDTPYPPVSAGAFSVAAGSLATVVDKPLSGGANFVIYEARCSDSVYAWVELDVVSGDWRLYGSAFSNGALTGNALELYSGDKDWDPPQLVCSGNQVIWYVMPVAGGAKTSQDSTCFLWKAGQSKGEAKIVSHGRFACAPTVSEGQLVCVPRDDRDGAVHYAIRSYSLSDDLASAKDELVLPQSIRPFSAVLLGGRLAFQIEANYQSGGLLGKMGTYVAQDDGSYVAISREPSAPPAGTVNTFIVKNRASYVVADLANATYGTLAAEDRSVDYGEYPARIGTCQDFVTFATVKDPSTSYPSAVVVRAFKVS